MNCIKCGRQTGDHRFRVLQVQTLHVRDLGGEKRVQALGDFEEYAVCAHCAEETYNDHMAAKMATLKSVVPFALLAIAGLAVILLFLHQGAIRLLGIGMFLCGILCAYSNAKTGGKRRRELSAMTREEGLRSCAWECMIQGAPKKNDINDITYIPVDETTLARKNGDLMILYDLLPEIAVQAYEKIHAEK